MRILFIIFYQFFIFYIYSADFTIKSSGSSFSYLFYQKSFNEFSIKNQTYVEYDPSNSLNGFIDLKNQAVDFAKNSQKKNPTNIPVI